MAGFEVKEREHVRELNDDQRKSICTSRRRAIVERAASSKKNGSFRYLCELCGMKVDFKDSRSVQSQPSPASRLSLRLQLASQRSNARSSHRQLEPDGAAVRSSSCSLVVARQAQLTSQAVDACRCSGQLSL